MKNRLPSFVATFPRPTLATPISGFKIRMFKIKNVKSEFKIKIDTYYLINIVIEYIIQYSQFQMGEP